MKVKFKVPRSLDGHDYTKGEQEVPDSLVSHWYLLALIQNGDAMIVEGPKGVKECDVPTQETAKTYHEHMSEWTSKSEKAAEVKANQPAQAPKPEDEKDALAAKKKLTAQKAAATRAAKKAQNKSPESAGV